MFRKRAEKKLRIRAASLCPTMPPLLVVAASGNLAEVNAASLNAMCERRAPLRSLELDVYDDQNTPRVIARRNTRYWSDPCVAAPHTTTAPPLPRRASEPTLSEKHLPLIAAVSLGEESPPTLSGQESPSSNFVESWSDPCVAAPHTTTAPPLPRRASEPTLSGKHLPLIAAVSSGEESPSTTSTGEMTTMKRRSSVFETVSRPHWVGMGCLSTKMMSSSPQVSLCPITPSRRRMIACHHLGHHCDHHRGPCHCSRSSNDPSNCDHGAAPMPSLRQARAPRATRHDWEDDRRHLLGPPTDRRRTIRRSSSVPPRRRQPDADQAPTDHPAVRASDDRTSVLVNAL